jgi:hypothetical protein
MREVKIRAVHENRRLKDVIADLLRRGLVAKEQESRGMARKRVTFPLVECSHPARPDEEMTPDRVAEVLLTEEAQGVGER